MYMGVTGNVLKQIKKRLVRHFDAKLFFMHIPKCGGTSVDNAIRLHRHNNRPWHQFHMNSEAAAAAARLSKMTWKAYNENLLLYAMANPQTSYITGHFFFSRTAYEHFGDSWDFITILRDPVERWFSQYYYNRFKSGRFLKTELSLVDYLRSTQGENASGTYATMLEGAGDHWAVDPEQTVKDAIENLSRFHLVGCLEHLDRFAARFQERHGISLDIGKIRKNPKANYAQRDEITPAIREQVAHLCRHDLKVYQHALEHLG